jgi:hypothetical protein
MSRAKLISIVFMLLLAASILWAGEPPSWGFIDANVTCKPAGKNRFRAKLVSQIFSYCGLDINRDQIVAGHTREIDEAAQRACKTGAYEVTNKALYADFDRTVVERYLHREETSPGYEVHDTIICSCVYPISNKCHSSQY